MATSSILPFANGVGANVLSDVDYAADSQLLPGQQPGLARSALSNKVLRQATAVAAAVAKFIADNQAVNITDSLTTADLATHLTTALAAGLAPALRNQTVTAYTTAGTSTAYTLDAAPDLAAYVAGKTRFNVTFHTANTSSTPTLNVDGLGAVPFKVLGAGNSKINPRAGQFPAGFSCDVLYDGTNFVVLSGGAGGGATGGGSDDVFYENSQTVTTDYTITSGKNAMSAGPVTVNVGVTVTIPVGSVWTVV